MIRHLIYRVPVPTGKLVGMSLPPLGFDWRCLEAVGISDLVSLCEVEEDRDVRPLNLLYACELKDIADEEVPEDPEGDASALWRAAFHVWNELRSGRGVAIHCNGSRHRTGTVICSTLRLSGQTAEGAAQIVDGCIRAIGAGPWGGSSWQMEQIRNPPAALSQHCGPGAQLSP